MPPNLKPKILVVEDDADIREIMMVQLLNHDYEVHLAADGSTATQIIQNNGTFHLYVLDWMIPAPSGIELCRLIRNRDEKGERIPILMVTAKAAPQFVITGLDAGADDYLTKPFPMEVFLARVRALLRRSPLLEEEVRDPGSEVLTRGPLSLNETKFEALCDNRPLTLTISEFKILKTLMEMPGHVFTRKQLIEKVAGPEIHVGGRTIDTQLVGLRKKLGDHGTLIETIRGIGYRFKEKIP